MKDNFLLTFIAIMLLSSCSDKIIPAEGYKLLTKRSYVAGIDNINLSSSIDLVPNFPKELQLKLEDSVMKYDDTLLSNYKTFKFKASLSKTYKIIIYSYCDCWGFDKYLFNPEIMIMNRAGKLVKTKLESSYVNPTSAPLAFDKTWVTEQQIEGDCFVILYSNNSELQKKFYHSTSEAYTGVNAPASVPVPISIKSTLVGKFRIQLQEK